MGEALDFDSIGEETAVAVGGLDLEAVRPKFKDFKFYAEDLLKTAKELVVIDQVSLTTAVMVGGNAKRFAKAVDVQVKAETLEYSEYVKGVRGIGKMITDHLDEAERITKQKIGQHQARVEMERLERERKAKEEAAALQRKLDEEAAAANRKAQEEARKRAEEEMRIKREKEAAEARERGAKRAELAALEKKAEEERLGAIRKAEEEANRNEVVAPTVVAPVVCEQSRITRTESGNAYQAKRWTCRIVDEKKVPREYCEPSQKLLNDSVKMGTRVIDGCIIEEITETRFRT